MAPGTLLRDYKYFRKFCLPKLAFSCVFAWTKKFDRSLFSRNPSVVRERRLEATENSYIWSQIAKVERKQPKMARFSPNLATQFGTVKIPLGQLFGTVMKKVSVVAWVPVVSWDLSLILFPFSLEELGSGVTLTFGLIYFYFLFSTWVRIRLMPPVKRWTFCGVLVNQKWCHLCWSSTVVWIPYNVRYRSDSDSAMNPDVK